MAGRGAIPVELSAEHTEAIRYRYVETDQPTRDLCADFGISTGKLARLIRKHGWPMRTERPPRELPRPLKLREEARRLAGVFPARGAARSDAPQTRGPGLPDDTGVPGLQRTTKTCCAAPGPQESDPNAQLEARVLRELAAEEAARAGLGRAPRERAEAEKSARTLSILAQTMQMLRRIRAGQAGAAQIDSIQSHHSDDDHSDDDVADLPADLDAFREALAQRIEAFVASQPDEEPVADGAGEEPAAARP
jgi:hypothetical protein